MNQNITAGGSESTGSKSVDFLPHFYTDVPPVTGSIKKSSVPATSIKSLSRDIFKQHVEKEYLWLDHVRFVVKLRLWKIHLGLHIMLVNSQQRIV